MIAFIARRLLQALLAAFLSTIVVFVFVHLLPGDPALVYAGQDATPELVEAIRREFGLDQPLPVQYLLWMSHVLRGDLGKSVLSGLPVIDLIKQRVPATLELAIAAMLLTIAIALPLGIISAVRRGSAIDTTIRIINGLALSIPSFWLGLLALLLFGLVLGWLPPGGRVDPFVNPLEGLKTLILPASTLAVRYAAGVTRFVRSSMLEVLGEDYVRTARAKGLRETIITLGHAMPNAMVPVTTVLGLQFGGMLGGSVITEVVFTWPGVGRLIVDAIGARDYGLVQGALLLYVAVFAAINLLTDLAYMFMDPRIRQAAAQIH